MRSQRGYTLVEILIVVGLIAVTIGVSVPVFLQSNALNDVWTSAERLGGLIRQTRLKAISRNATYEVRFNCPSAGSARGLIMTGDVGVDDAAGRCSTTTDGDTDVVVMPVGVTLDLDGATGLQVTGRGDFTAEGVGVSIPHTLSVSQGSGIRSLRDSITGQITFIDGPLEEE